VRVSARSGIVFVDVEWHRDLLAEPDPRPIRACWNVEDTSKPEHPDVIEEFDNVDAALTWARDRAAAVLVRLGSTQDQMYSAGARRLRSFPVWPPAD
jgi:hypothetical protein